MHSKEFKKLQSDEGKVEKKRSGQAMGTVFEEDRNSESNSVNASTFSNKL